MPKTIDTDLQTACNTLKAGRSISPQRRNAAIAAIKRLSEKIDIMNESQLKRLKHYHSQWHELADEQVEASVAPLVESAASRLAGL